jgi:hypothetical protein
MLSGKLRQKTENMVSQTQSQHNEGLRLAQGGLAHQGGGLLPGIAGAVQGDGTEAVTSELQGRGVAGYQRDPLKNREVSGARGEKIILGLAGLKGL